MPTDVTESGLEILIVEAMVGYATVQPWPEEGTGRGFGALGRHGLDPRRLAGLRSRLRGGPAKNSDMQNARIEHDGALKRVLAAVFNDDTELFK